MAEYAQLDRPGVEVIQEFVSATPTILRPSLQACIVGPCKQVVEAVQDDGTLNQDARVSLPGRLTTKFASTPFQYPNVGGKHLTLSVNNGPATVIVLPATNPTARQVVDAILTEAVPGLTARVEESGDSQRVVLETISSGDNASLVVTSDTHADVLAAFGFTAGQRAPGADGYDNSVRLRIQAPDYPDPRQNEKDLKIVHKSVRVFVSPGGGAPREVSRSSSYLTGAATAVSVHDDGDGDSLSPYFDFTGANFSQTAAKAKATGIADVSAINWASDVQGRVLRLSLDGEPFQTLVVPNTVNSLATLVTAINALWGADIAVAASGNKLELNSPSPFGGAESSISVDKNASAASLLTALGLTGTNAPFTSTSVVGGRAYKPAVGDEVWIDGLRVGAITEVPASPTNRLRLDTEKLVDFTGDAWYVVAKGLNNSVGTAQRPSSDLVVDEDTGTVLIKPGLFRGVGGEQTVAKGLGVFVAYDALRLDVTPAKAANDFNLVRIGSLSALEKQLAPIDTDNPLALGIYFALLNCPGLEVAGCGVDEAGEGAPEGTADGYARAFEFLESKDGLYTIVPMTHSADVGSIAATHVKVMSEPGNSLERITVLTPKRPSRKSATLVASGTRGNLSGPPSDVVETGLANLGALLAQAGKPGPTYDEDDDVYLMFEGDSNHYLIQSAVGGQVTVNNGPLQDNSDGYYFEGAGQPVFEEMIVDRPFTIAIRGGALGNLTDEAAAYGDLGRGYKSNRVIVTAPDTVKATLDGLESAIPGYYAGAAIAGRKAAKNPSQPMTEDTLAGFTGAVGTQERYSEPQLRIMSGGGIWVLYQDADGQPLRTRQQLTTDVGTLLTRESSITDALDYAAKTLRTTFRNFIGRYNITTGLIESLNLVCDSVTDFLITNQIFAAFNVVELIQDANNEDTLSIVADVTTLKPLNHIRITMRVI